MEGLIDKFHSIVKDFRLKRHDLLAYHNNKFDRDYVEFNVKISDLECSLQARECKNLASAWEVPIAFARPDILSTHPVLIKIRSFFFQSRWPPR